MSPLLDLLVPSGVPVTSAKLSVEVSLVSDHDVKYQVSCATLIIRHRGDRFSREQRQELYLNSEAMFWGETLDTAHHREALTIIGVGVHANKKSYHSYLLRHVCLSDTDTAEQIAMSKIGPRLTEERIKRVMARWRRRAREDVARHDGLYLPRSCTCR